ncbi:transporter substrate-binding domain-containing protein [Microbacterium sp. EYE_5]|uniref:ABC transporter substrate-binding protein n=1 Tax=unclassified Microbacterium TaxID=2609290 RepID=UPI00249E009F|nr:MULTISPECIES: transporter substrate-binding domain-containing protein [unclassified Microbacterium]MCK6081618.1 transporter substrate-binding domain-containing protein [Microbacterium sp. EYE_382]MCK6086888.1 transporter substrate-binding domain-containing protein [Microbacterium sp. EYE_384]MCK6123614.1 transporter substrate-binding domain-containing protein [Microbacterium sp. EYE_80]MCK6126523.1 transporter substrate-binding domain-containing protein [Microbacterium sp. EYE_79]MCK6142572
MSRRPALRTAVAASAAAFALLFAGCATNAPAGGSSAEATDAAPSPDDYVTPGKLTIATGETAYEPYVIDDDPASGEGFEAAVAYAVADKLGFAEGDVEWVRTSFDAAIAPGPKSFDFNVQQYTITDERKQGVDFSSPYYSASQSLIALKGGAADGVTDLDGLKDITIGAMANSTSALTLDALDLGLEPKLYNSNEDATAALSAGQVDAVVLDTPTAYVAVNFYIEDSFFVGELPKSGIEDQWGLLLAKDSPLTPAVSAAVDELREDGTLADLEEEWLSGLTEGVTELQ